MKRLILSLFLFSVTAFAVQAQQTSVQQHINARYVNNQHKQFMYLVNPAQKELDSQLVQQQQEFEAGLLEAPALQINTASDTSWSYAESKSYFDSVYTPYTYTHYHTLGDTIELETNYDEYVWHTDSLSWFPKREQTSFYTNSLNDSSITYYYNYGETEPYFGNKYRYVFEPAEGADFESYFDNYYPETEWEPNTHTLVFRDENGRDTLTQEDTYNAELMTYQRSYERRYKYSENYNLSEYKYFWNGELNGMNRNEQTPEFLLDENYTYHLGEISGGTRNYTLLREDGAYVYNVGKEWNNIELKLQNEDSTYYHYLDNNTRIEAEGYFWDDSVWIYDQLYTTFQREVGELGFLVDSIIVYDVDLDEELGERVVSHAYIKTEMDYDATGNQVEVRTYQAVNDTLQLFGIVKRKYKTINTSTFSYSTEVFSRDWSTGVVYHSSMSETLYDGDVYRGNKYFTFNALGDTTYGYQTQYEDLPDGSQAIVQFTWDYVQKKLLLANFRINRREIQGDDGKTYNQTAYVQILPTGEYAINRTMNGYTSYPGIFNDGPIPAAQGDTVSLYLSARNPDMTMPEIMVDDMPSTATFDPQTNHFFWVVDEANPSPMTYTATRNGIMSVSTQVYFQVEEFTIPVEEEASPYSFHLAQNYPNPFNPATVIHYQLPQNSLVSLKVYDLVGREVANLVDGNMTAGNHEVHFDASQLSSGMYIYRLQAGSNIQTRKMLLVK